MAIQSKENPLNYTGLSYEDIKSQINASLRSDERFANFVDSALYKSMMNLFAGSTDLTNYYVERTAEEMYLETAQHLSSIILNANNLGYIVRRPLGSTANISFKIEGQGLTPTTSGSIINIPMKSELNYNGAPFLLTDSYSYELTQDDANILNGNGSISFNNATNSASAVVPIDILQGELRTFEILPGNQISRKFQKYNIIDPSFSNYYGETDLGGWDIDESSATKNLTSVRITNGVDFRDYYINKRSLTVDQNTHNLIQSSADIPDVCLIKTNKDTTVDIYFGDGISTSLGAETGETIIVEYFSVLGSAANRTSVLNNEIEFNGNITLDTVSINDNVSTFFKTNILNGQNMEDKESIRLNAPAIYQSLDRLVTINDYKAFLKTIVTPIIVNNAVAWGESDEIAAQAAVGNNINAIKELFNIVLTSVIASAYKIENGKWKPKGLILNSSNSIYKNNEDIENSYVEYTNNIDDLIESSNGSYFDFYIKKDPANYFNYLYNDTSVVNFNIRSYLKQILDKSQATVKNVYITPIVQGFTLQGTVILKNFVDIGTESEKINESIYSSLNELTDFKSPVYISNVTDIINSIPSVKYSSISFEPIGADDGNKLINIQSQVVSTSANYEQATINDLSEKAAATLFTYLNKDTTANDVDSRIDGSVYTPITADTNLDIDTSKKIIIEKLNDIFSGTSLETDILVLQDEFRTSTIDNRRMKDFNERGFYEKFALVFYDLCIGVNDINGVEYRNSEDFKKFINKVKASMQTTLINGMKDEYGNIVNYSFPNELPLIFSELTFKY